MAKSCLAATVLLGGLLAFAVAESQPGLEIKLGPPLEIGRADLLFASIASVCEDGAANFYVLDRQEQAVLKFSPDGRLLLKFGRKGQGPGDFQSPGRIAFTSAGELAVLEDVGSASFFSMDGRFLRRLDLNGRLGLGFVGPDRYYGWDRRSGDRQQLLVDSKNTVLATFHVTSGDLFSTVMPDETGRLVMFSYVHEACTPQFLFAHGAGLSAVGISDRYEIAILDEQGRNVITIKREVRPGKVGARERELLEREFGDFVKSKNWPEQVVRELRKKTPAFKSVLAAVLISPKNIFVLQVPADITLDPPRYPVDVFTHEGDFLGTGELSEVPLFVSEKAMYFSRADADENVYLVRRPYSF
jgi:hypothetical protein